MKKTLITILLAILMSVGAFASADLVQAEEVSAIPEAYSITRQDNDSLMIELSMDNLKKAIIEYSFYSNDILMSKLIDVSLNLISSDSTNNKYSYTFSVPEEALSVIVWRVVTSNKEIKSLTGSFELTEAQETSISAVETRLKTVFINDDLITKEIVLTSMGGMLTNSFKFKMHFNLEDYEGNTIPVDRIHSLKVEYDILHTFLWGLIKPTPQHIVKVIEATETRNATFWPFITPETVIKKIDRSSDPKYMWYVDLGTFMDSDKSDFLKLEDVTLDLTSILEISYYYNGVFYERETVVDEPYDAEDIITVIPGTTTQLTNIIDIINNLSSTFQIIIYIIAAILVIAILFLILKLLKAIEIVWKTIKMIFKSIGKAIKYFFMFTCYFLKFVFIMIPKGLYKSFVFLITPKNKRKEKRYAGRYI